QRQGRQPDDGDAEVVVAHLGLEHVATEQPRPGDATGRHPAEAVVHEQIGRRHERERQRGDGEEDAAQAQRRQADDNRSSGASGHAVTRSRPSDVPDVRRSSKHANRTTAYTTAVRPGLRGWFQTTPASSSPKLTADTATAPRSVSPPSTNAVNAARSPSRLSV